MNRTLNVTWRDPAEGEDAARTLSGIDYLRAMASGDAPPPPLVTVLGMKLEGIEEGRVVITVVPAEYHYNPRGVVHGGLAAALFDSALGCAVQSLLPAASAAPTIQLQVNYVRPITVATGKLRCSGEVLHIGRKSATAEGRLVDASGKLYAHATAVFILTGLEDGRDG
jgi:uncharacterized protein (TIGR00369 family)